jgi:hypothetical protein
MFYEYVVLKRYYQLAGYLLGSDTMTQRMLHVFTTIILALTVGILLAAGISRLPIDWLAAMAHPQGMQLATVAALGLLTLLEGIVIAARTPAYSDPTWQLALFPSMPGFIGALPEQET